MKHSVCNDFSDCFHPKFRINCLIKVSILRGINSLIVLGVLFRIFSLITLSILFGRNPMTLFSYKHRINFLMKVFFWNTVVLGHFFGRYLIIINIQFGMISLTVFSFSSE